MSMTKEELLLLAGQKIDEAYGHEVHMIDAKQDMVASNKMAVYALTELSGIGIGTDIVHPQRNVRVQKLYLSDAPYEEKTAVKGLYAKHYDIKKNGETDYRRNPEYTGLLVGVLYPDRFDVRVEIVDVN